MKDLAYSICINLSYSRVLWMTAHLSATASFRITSFDFSLARLKLRSNVGSIDNFIEVIVVGELMMISK